MGYFSIICLASFISVVPLFFVSIKTYGKATIMGFMESIVVIALAHLYYMRNNSDQDPFYFIAIFVLFSLALFISLGINFSYLWIKSSKS